MTRTWFALHVFAAVAALSLIMLTVAVGVGESQPAGPAQTTTAPSQLTEQFPLGDRKLAEDGSSAARSDAGGGSGAPDGGGSLLWLLFLVPVALVVLMVWLVAYARSGPPTAYGYALGNEPRRRRQVPASVIRLLTPLFAYNHHRDAYILRGIGNRRGPVLKEKGAEPWAVKPAVAPPAAAPIGVRGESRPARPASNGGAPANGAPPERRRRPRVEAPARTRTDTEAEAPPAAKPKAATPKSGKANAAKKTKANGHRSAPTGRFERDEDRPVREDRPATKTRK